MGIVSPCMIGDPAVLNKQSTSSPSKSYPFRATPEGGAFSFLESHLGRPHKKGKSTPLPKRGEEGGTPPSEHHPGRDGSWLVDCLFSAARSLLVRNEFSSGPRTWCMTHCDRRGVRPTVGSSRSATLRDEDALQRSIVWRLWLLYCCGAPVHWIWVAGQDSTHPPETISKCNHKTMRFWSSHIQFFIPPSQWNYLSTKSPPCKTILGIFSRGTFSVMPSILKKASGLNVKHQRSPWAPFCGESVL